MNITLTVYWEGTANTLDPPTTQIGLFWCATQAVDVTDEGVSLPPQKMNGEDQHLKMAFDGCAVTNGTLGLLFASGLRQQAARVVNRIKEIQVKYTNETFIIVNVLGLSRGGVAAIFLGQALKQMSSDEIELNLLLFDPVPGDQTWSGFPYTGSFAKDLSDCACLRRVLALYPHEPLPDITFHAPVLPAYPSHCEIEEDVILGCHQGALFATRRSSHAIHQASNLSFRRIVDFFTLVGTPLDLETYFSYQPSKLDVLGICRKALDTIQPTTRKLHDGLQRGRMIVRRPSGKFLNKYHEQLEREERGDKNMDAYAAKDETGGFSSLRDVSTTVQKNDVRHASDDEHANNLRQQVNFNQNEHFASYTPPYMLDITIPDQQRACFLLPTSSSFSE